MVLAINRWALAVVVLAVVAVPESASARSGGLSSYDELVLSHRPVAYWRLSHPSQGKETDRTGNDHVGTFRGVTSTVRLPNQDGASVFDGVSDSFEVPSAKQFHISTKGKFTVEAWIMPQTLQFANEEQSGYVYFMGKGTKSDSGGNREWAGRMYSKTNTENRPNRISGYAWNPEGGYGAGAYFQQPVKANEWIHYAITFDTAEGTYGKVRIYRDGVLAGTDNLAYRPGTADEVIVKPKPGSAPVRVGTRDGKSYFKGAVGKFAIYDRELSAAELRSHYVAMTASSPQGPDFNSDGIGDIFSAATGTLNVWNGKGGNNFSSRIEVGPNWSVYSRPIASDFNGDGVGDLMAVKDGTLHVWNGKGSNNFTSAIVLGPGWTPYAGTLMSLGDINGDGHTDIGAVANDTLHVWNGKGSNNFSSRIEKGPGWTPYSSPIGGDFNSDGIGDLMAVKDGILHVWNGKGSNNFASAIALGPGWTQYAPTLMTLGDINNDGHTDIAAVSNDHIHVWNGKGSNNFSSRIELGPGWTQYFPN